MKVSKLMKLTNIMSNYMLRSLKEHSIVIFIFSPVIIECVLDHANESAFLLE